VGVNVLAVGDPAVYGYTDKKLGILSSFQTTTDIDVNFDILPWAEYGSRLFSVIEENSPRYDVVMVAGHLWLPGFAAKGALAPLDDLEPLNSREYDAGDIMPGVQREMTYQGARYLVPSFSDGHLVYIREGEDRLVGEDGTVDVRRFDRIATALSAAPGFTRQAAMIMKTSPSEIYLDWLPYLRAFGGEFLSPEGEPLFHSTAGREALEYYIKLRSHLSEKHAPFGNEEVAAALRDGVVSFGISWGGQAGVIVTKEAVEQELFTYASPSYPWNVTWSFGILSGSTAQNEAAHLLSWLSGRDSDKKIGRYAGSPCRQSTYDDPDLKRRCPWFSAQEAMVERAIPLPSRPDLAALISPMYTALAKAYVGELSVAKALDLAAGEVEAAL
jgi:multiple sugar transport system substrate-binding protein